MIRKMPEAVRRSTALYRALLVLYPLEHRRAYSPLMEQAFRDLCHEAYERGGKLGVALLWPRILADTARSALVAHLEAAKEGLMIGNRAAVPLPWREVALVVTPGLLFALGKAFYPVGKLALPLFILVLIVGTIVWGRSRHIPVWSLLALGLMFFGGLLLLVVVTFDQLRNRVTVGRDGRTLAVLVVVWAAMIALVVNHARTRRVPSMAWALLAVIVAGSCVPGGYDLATAPPGAGAWSLLVDIVVPTLNFIGILLLPVALGLPLARRHGSLATLVVVGAHSIWLFDSDFISGWLLRDRAFYPVYASLLPMLFIGVGPLLFVRARSRRAQVIGLLAPISAMLIARVAVPWLLVPDSLQSEVWVAEVLLSVMALLVLLLALVLYEQADRAEPAPIAAEMNHPIFAA